MKVIDTERIPIKIRLDEEDVIRCTYCGETINRYGILQQDDDTQHLQIFHEDCLMELNGTEGHTEKP